MSFMIKASVLQRILVLALFIVSIIGPWMFDLIYVPAQYTCDAPFVRLDGDFCGYPMSGFDSIRYFSGGVFYSFGELIKGNFASQIPEILILMGILIIVMPFFSDLLLIGNQKSRRLQTINRIGWGLAGLLTLTMLFSQTNRGGFIQFFHLWGLGLYVLLAISTVLFEIITWRVKLKASIKL